MKSSFSLFFLVLCFLHFPKSVITHLWDNINEAERQHVKNLTHDVELQIYSQHSKNAIALFCNDEEPKCKNVYHEFVKASNELVGKEIAFVYVDTLLLPKTADNFDIRSVPKILTFRDYDAEKGYTFYDKHTKENIKKWFEALPIPSVEVMTLNSTEKYIEMQKKKGYAALLAYGVKNSNNVQKFFHFGETHSLQNLSVGLAYVEKEEDEKIEIFNGPGVTIPNENIKYKDTFVPKKEKTWVSEEISIFAAEYMKQFPIIINYSRKMTKPKDGDIYFYIFNFPTEYADATYAELYSVIIANPQMKFVFPISEERGELFGDIRENYMLSILDYRNASFDTPSQLLRPKKYFKTFNENIKASDASEFINDFNENKLKRFMKSEKPVKRLEITQFQKVCADNFETYVLDPEKIVLVFYHVEGCKECAPIFPFWEKVAHHFHLDYKNVLVATMDSKLNDMFDEKVENFPSLVIYPTGNNKMRNKRNLLFPVKMETLEDIVDEFQEGDFSEEL